MSFTSIVIAALSLAVAGALGWVVAPKLFPGSKNQQSVVALSFAAIGAVLALGIQSALAPAATFTADEGPALRAALTDTCMRWCRVQDAEVEVCRKVCDCAVEGIAARNPEAEQFVAWFGAMSGQDKEGFQEWLSVRGECSRRYAPQALKPRNSAEPTVTLPSRTEEPSTEATVGGNPTEPPAKSVKLP